MKHPEQSLHQSVARYLDVALPKDVFWTTVPAGGGGAKRGAFLKSCGYRAGVPDLMFIIRGQAWFIELKTPKGRLSPAQIETAEAINRAGGVVVVARSVDEVADFLIQRGVQLRGRLAA